MALNNIKIISAGAGSGKTYRLTKEMTALLSEGKVRAAGIIATTFTKKAAAELKERVRVKLLKEGRGHEANELSNALIGTVHGLGVKLLQRFAFEAGVSPQVEIIPDEDHQRLFNLSMAAVIDVKTIERIEQLINRLGLSAGFGKPYDWRQEVRQIVEVIRANDFDDETIAYSKQQSWITFKEFLPPVTDRSRESINNGLATLLDSTREQLENNENDQTKLTLSYAQKLRGLKRELEQKQYLNWPKWAGLCNPKVGAKSKELVEDLAHYAASHTSFSAFQQDIKDFIYLLFDCAKDAIKEYARYKQQRGQIDYTDMEVLVLRLLDDPIVQETLSEELDLLMVDEFQDTSPIQLAIFIRLSQLARQSIWVGDPKQSIYGFRGAEPRLMAAVLREAGGVKPENIQDHSYRSREDLVYVTNDIFTRAFPDIPQAEVRLKPKRTRAGSDFGLKESEEQAADTALWHWHYELDGKGRISKSWKFGVLAKSVAELLANPPLIRPKGSKEYRSLQAADIAILCRTNFGCLEMATALYDAGLPAAVARTGLLQTAECVLILASLKYMLNQEDSLSVAELKLLAGKAPLEAIVNDRLDYLAGLPEAPKLRYAHPKWGEDESFINQLDELRQSTQEYAPAELLNYLLETLDLRRIIVSWGNGEQRLSNVDELRKLVLAYEENCHRLQQAASVGGFLLNLNKLSRNKQDRQGAGERPEAVNVLTYHRSKGLEWPIVICNDLDQPLRAELWGRHIVNTQEKVDINQPLAGRWLRYWVNPYDKSGSKLDLIEALKNSHWQEEKTAEALAEEARLLYVGITRARDYLVLPTTKDGAPWLDRVYRSGETPVLDPHSDQAPFSWKEHEVDKKTQDWTEPKTLTRAALQLQPIPFIKEQGGGRKSYLPSLVTPTLMNERFPISGFKPDQLHAYYPTDLSPELYTPEFGLAISAFISADKPESTEDERIEMAEGLILNFGLPETAKAAQFLAQSEAFYSWIDSQLETAHRQLNLPISYQDGQHYYSSAIDLLFSNDTYCLSISHCVLAIKHWDKKLAQQLPESNYQASVLNELIDDQLQKAWIHLPLQGKILQITDWKVDQ